MTTTDSLIIERKHGVYGLIDPLLFYKCLKIYINFSVFIKLLRLIFSFVATCFNLPFQLYST